jgi:WD40 repeat protein
MRLLAAQPSVLDLVRTPFVLRLLVEAFPLLWGSSSSAWTRYDIFKAFSTQWFGRGVQRLQCCERTQLEDPFRLLCSLHNCSCTQRQSPSQVPCSLESRFALTSALIAGQMLLSGKLELPVAGQSWDDLVLVTHVWIREDVIPSIDFESVYAQEFIKALVIPNSAGELASAVLETQSRGLRQCLLHKEVCPIRIVGGHMQFFHTTFFEFFSAQLILLAAGGSQPLPFRVARTRRVLNLDGRRIQDVPEVLYFLSDVWHSSRSRDPIILRARECLLEMISTTASEADPSIRGPAANAATLLNWVGEPMCKVNWAGVKLLSADLTRAVLCGATLDGALLNGCRLDQSVLTSVSTNNTDLSEARFGHRPPLLTGGAVQALTCVEGSAVLVVVHGRLQVWNSATCELVRGPQLLDFPAAVQVNVGFDGRARVAVSSLDGRVHVWERTDGLKLQQTWSSPSPMALVCCLVAVTDGFVACADADSHVVQLLCTAEDGQAYPSFPVGDSSITCIAFLEPSPSSVGAPSPLSLCVGHSTGFVTVLTWRDYGSAPCARVLTSTSARQGVAPGAGAAGSVKSLATRAIVLTGSDSGSSRHLVAAGYSDGSIRVVDLLDDTLVCHPLRGHSRCVTCLSFTAALDTVVVLSGSEDGTVRLWDVDFGRPYCEPFVGHAAPITCVASIDPSTVASGDRRGCVRLWGLGRRHGERVYGHREAVSSVVFSSAPAQSPCDDSVLFSIGEDNLCHVVHVNPRAPVSCPKVEDLRWVNKKDFVTCLIVGPVHPSCDSDSTQVNVFAGYDSGALRHFVFSEGKVVREELADCTFPTVTSKSLLAGVFCDDMGMAGHVATHGEDRVVRVWNTHSKSRVYESQKVDRRGCLVATKSGLHFVGLNGDMWSWKCEGPTSWSPDVRAPVRLWTQRAAVMAACGIASGGVIAAVYTPANDSVRVFDTTMSRATTDTARTADSAAQCWIVPTCSSLGVSSSPDSGLLVGFGFVDGRVAVSKCREDGTCLPITSGSGHDGPVTCVTLWSMAATDSGVVALVATSGVDGKVRLWHVLSDLQLVLRWSSRTERQQQETTGLAHVSTALGVPAHQLALIAYGGCEEAAQWRPRVPAALQVCCMTVMADRFREVTSKE